MDSCGPFRSAIDTPSLSWASEHAPELEEPFVMPGVAHAAADKERPDDRLGQHTRGDIIRDFAFVWRAVHLCHFVRPNYKNSFPDQRRQNPQVMQITCPEQVVLISLQLIQSIRAERQRPAQKELRNARVGKSKSRSSLAVHEHRT